MKLFCNNCGLSYEAPVGLRTFGPKTPHVSETSVGELAMWSECPACRRKFIVEDGVPKGRIHMVYGCEDTRRNTIEWDGYGVWSIYAYDTVAEFLKAWTDMARGENPDTSLYWVLEGAEVVASGHPDLRDYETFVEHWGNPLWGITDDPDLEKKFSITEELPGQEVAVCELGPFVMTDDGKIFTQDNAAYYHIAYKPEKVFDVVIRYVESGPEWFVTMRYELNSEPVDASRLEPGFYERITDELVEFYLTEKAKAMVAPAPAPVPMPEELSYLDLLTKLKASVSTDASMPERDKKEVNRRLDQLAGILWKYSY